MMCRCKLIARRVLELYGVLTTAVLPAGHAELCSFSSADPAPLAGCSAIIARCVHLHTGLHGAVVSSPTGQMSSLTS